MQVILIGFMGSGKTTVSALLSQQLNLPVTDLDQAVVQASGKSIPRIFHDGGEAVFRHLESETLTAILSSRDGILATGGGTPLRASNRAKLAADPAPVILLHASPTETARRIYRDRGRPLASRLDTTGLEKLLAERQACYEACTDYTIATDNRSPREIAAEIITLLHQNKH